MEGVELARMMADYLQQAIQKRVEANGDLPCMICDNELMKNGVTSLWEDELTGDLCIGRDGQNHTVHKPHPSALKNKGLEG